MCQICPVCFFVFFCSFEVIFDSSAFLLLHQPKKKNDCGNNVHPGGLLKPAIIVENKETLKDVNDFRNTSHIIEHGRWVHRNTHTHTFQSFIEKQLGDKQSGKRWAGREDECEWVWVKNRTWCDHFWWRIICFLSKKEVQVWRGRRANSLESHGRVWVCEGGGCNWSNESKFLSFSLWCSQV